MKPVTKLYAVVILSGATVRKFDEIALPLLPISLLRMRLICKSGERRVISVGLTPTTPSQLRRYGVAIPHWCDTPAFRLFLFCHMADVEQDIAKTLIEVTPVCVSNHIDPTDAETIDVVWELVHDSQLTQPESKELPRAFSFREFEMRQRARRQIFAKTRTKQPRPTQSKTH